MAVRLSALYVGHPNYPRRFLLLVSIRGRVDPRAIVQLEGLGELKKANDLIGNRIPDFLACSIVPKPTTLSCASVWDDNMNDKWIEKDMEGSGYGLIWYILLEWVRWMTGYLRIGDCRITHIAFCDLRPCNLIDRYPTTWGDTSLKTCHIFLFCSQVTITTRQLVSHIAGIRHYEKATNNNKNSDKEVVRKQMEDRRNVRNFSAFCFGVPISCCCSIFSLSSTLLILSHNSPTVSSLDPVKYTYPNVVDWRYILILLKLLKIKDVPQK
jgi:hypothetical protein